MLDMCFQDEVAYEEGQHRRGASRRMNSRRLAPCPTSSAKAASGAAKVYPQVQEQPDGQKAEGPGIPRSGIFDAIWPKKGGTLFGFF